MKKFLIAALVVIILGLVAYFSKSYWMPLIPSNEDVSENTGLIETGIISSDLNESATYTEDAAQGTSLNKKVATRDGLNKIIQNITLHEYSQYNWYVSDMGSFIASASFVYNGLGFQKSTMNYHMLLQTLQSGKVRKCESNEDEFGNDCIIDIKTTIADIQAKINSNKIVGPIICALGQDASPCRLSITVSNKGIESTYFLDMTLSMMNLGMGIDLDTHIDEANTIFRTMTDQANNGIYPNSDVQHDIQTMLDAISIMES